MSNPLIIHRSSITHTSSALQAESFDELLQKTLRDPKLMSDLLGHSVFLDRGYRICRWLVRSTNLDAWELFNIAYLKVLAKKDKLRVDNTPNSKAFFRWFYQLTLNIRRDQWRKDNREVKRTQSISFSYEETSNADSFNTGPGVDLEDPWVDLDGDCFLKEFLEFTNTLSKHHRRAIMLRLENYPDKGVPYDEVAETLNSEGITCCGVTVRTWVRASWNAFLNGKGVSSGKKAVAF